MSPVVDKVAVRRARLRVLMGEGLEKGERANSSQPTILSDSPAPIVAPPVLNEPNEMTTETSITITINLKLTTEKVTDMKSILQLLKEMEKNSPETVDVGSRTQSTVLSSSQAKQECVKEMKKNSPETVEVVSRTQSSVLISSQAKQECVKEMEKNSPETMDVVSRTQSSVLISHQANQENIKAISISSDEWQPTASSSPLGSQLMNDDFFAGPSTSAGHRGWPSTFRPSTFRPRDSQDLSDEDSFDDQPTFTAPTGLRRRVSSSVKQPPTQILKSLLDSYDRPSTSKWSEEKNNCGQEAALEHTQVKKRGRPKGSKNKVSKKVKRCNDFDGAKGCCNIFFGEDGPFVLTGCGHLFHENCINRWERVKKCKDLCALCGQTHSGTHNVYGL